MHPNNIATATGEPTQSTSTPQTGTPSAPTTPASTPAPTTRDYPYLLDLTEGEGRAIEALREWSHAQNDPTLRAELEAWDLMRVEVDRFREGKFTLADAVVSVGKDKAPVYFAAVKIVASALVLFGAREAQSNG